MLAELRMELSPREQELGWYQSSNLQGVLMERIDSSYGDKMHAQNLHPYSQCLTTEDGRLIWHVKTLQEEAYHEIIEPLEREDFSSFTITKKGLDITVVKKELVTKDKKELLEEFYHKPGSRTMHIEFLTPASFKSGGRYQVMPDVRLLFQSLMNKYSASAEDELEMFDEETLEQLAAYSEIYQYRLKSTYFPVEGIRIPSYKGEMTLRLHGTDTLARYVRFLLRFGEYSGIGIKTAMGMGAIRVTEGRTRDD